MTNLISGYEVFVICTNYPEITTKRNEQSERTAAPEVANGGTEDGGRIQVSRL